MLSNLPTYERARQNSTKGLTIIQMHICLLGGCINICPEQEGEGDEAMERLSDDDSGADAADEAAAATAAAAAAAGSGDARAAAASPLLTLALPAQLALPPGALAELRSELFPPAGPPAGDASGRARAPARASQGLDTDGSGVKLAGRKRRPSAGAEARLGFGGEGASEDAAAETAHERAPCAWQRMPPALQPPGPGAAAELSFTRCCTCAWHQVCCII